MKRKSPSIPLWNCPIWTRLNSGIFCRPRTRPKTPRPCRRRSASYPFEDPVAIVYNDDGKLMGLPLNRALRDECGEAYEVKRGKFTSVKGARPKRFIRFRALGAGYSEEELKAVLAGEAEHCPRKKHPVQEQKFQMLVDIQAKLAEGKGDGYARWAKRYNREGDVQDADFSVGNKSEHG